MPPAYVNIQMPWDGHENPQAPKPPEECRVALYRRTFALHDSLQESLSKQGHARLRFEGFATALYIWVDGIFVGYCEDGYTASEFDITSALTHSQEHEIVVACYEYSSALVAGRTGLLAFPWHFPFRITGSSACLPRRPPRNQR